MGPQVFKVVDYRGEPGVQHCGLQERPQVFNLVDYRGAQVFSVLDYKLAQVDWFGG